MTADLTRSVVGDVGLHDAVPVMLEEIFEQPEAVRNTLCDRVDVESGDVHLPDLKITDWDLTGLTRLVFVGYGSSFHAALVGKYVVEAFARLPVEVDIASEFCHRAPVLDGRVLTVSISSSGGTADALAALRHARTRGSLVAAICNGACRSIAREAIDGVLDTRGGIEIGVTSTKAFTTQLAAVLLLGLKLGRARGMLDTDVAQHVIRDLHAVPAMMEDILACNDAIGAIAQRFSDRTSLLCLGRGIHYPLALEGALKLKEIADVHAEGHAAGEMNHGRIALNERGMPVVALVPVGATYQKTIDDIEAVKARNAVVIAIATRGDDAIHALADHTILIPPASAWMQPFLVALALQLFAYHIARIRSSDVDQRHPTRDDEVIIGA